MINITTGKIYQRIKLVFGFILFLGVGIAGSVYFLGDHIARSTQTLVHDDLPIYLQFQKLRNQLTEQERQLYEYYASFEDKFYNNGFASAQAKVDQVTDSLRLTFGEIPPLIAIHSAQQRIIVLADQFDRNMQLRAREEGTDWDLARKQLSEISLSTRSMAPHIESLTDIVTKRIVASQRTVDSQLLYVNVFVAIYAFITLLIAFTMARALKAYLASSAVSQRLALFPKRTPNPIISLDENNNVTYTNPATKRLLKRLGRDQGKVDSLLAPDLITHQRSIQKSERHFGQFEYAVDNLTFICELHWLEDQQQWDLHLSDVSAQAAAEEKLNFQAYHHPETSLDNQYRFREVLNNDCDHNKHFTLGLIEIRSFNQLLAANSFEKVQQLVVEIAAVLDKSCHDLGLDVELYHIGDKNFAVRIPRSDCRKTVVLLVSKMREQISLAQFSGQHQIDLDFGFSCFPQHADKLEDVIHHARMALDASAKDEHSQYQLFSDELGAIVKRQQLLIKEIRSAIDEESFQLYFQPQMSFENNQIIGAEVLIRWHLKDQWISPAEFIPLAEQSGLIIPLGDWILETACLKARQIIELGYPDIVIAVNISPKQFSSPNFVEKVKNVLDKHQIPAKNLELEITEGVIFNNETDTIQSLHKLKEMGVMLSIDDFGTGYSSLSYLKQFPIDKLKIDQSFIRNMHINNDDQSIVRTIISLGANLGLTLIAEGVEEQEQVEILRAMGCDEIQGYWYSKPLDEGYFTYFLQSKKSVA